MIEAGTTVDDYRVERMIGRGGMGVVYEAVETTLKRRVALKVLRADLADDPEFVERFRREARLQASLEHPHVLEVYDVGESDQGLYLAMRLVSGRTLLDLLRERELDADRALALLDQVTGALDVAHAADLVHRDVKPQNVLVDEGDKAYLADFGLTRAASETTVTSSTPLLGSVAYVAPEVVRGAEPTPASDRYSVAATVFHCLTGDVVFPRGSDAAVLYAHAAETPPSVRERRRELPEAVDEALAPALSKEPDARPASARSIVGAVRDALGSVGRGLGPPPPPPPREPLATGFPPADGRPAERRSGRTLVWLALALLAAAAGFAAGFALEGEEESADVAVRPVPAGAEPLNSDLGLPDRSVDCRGEQPTASSPACSIVQSDLEGATLLAPADGVVVGWAVRGAEGELSLDVIRPRGSDTVRVGKSQWESAGNPGPHYFETRLPVEAGDQLGLQLGEGASIGVIESEGATTQRWMRPLGGAYGRPDRAEGTGLDYEIAFRADFVAGERVELPEHLTGAAAARAPDGRVREHASITVEDPGKQRLRLELVELEDRVALDVSREGTRTLRVFIDGLRPKGIPVEIDAYTYPGEPFGEAGVWWTNPNSGRVNFHFFLVGDGLLEFAG